MTHLWLRAEQRADEERSPMMPEGAAKLIAAGCQITIEESRQRCIPLAAYKNAGCSVAPEGSWPTAPGDAIILGLKELPEDGSPLRHDHIMFGHAFKGQPAGRRLLDRFKSGGGTLLDLEYLTDKDNRRVAAFGYWAGYTGAAVALKCWIAQQHGKLAGPVTAFANAAALRDTLLPELQAIGAPTVLIIGALGRVGTGATDLCTALGLTPTLWDIAETRSGGPFPAVLAHDIFLNCILAREGTPVFVPADTPNQARELTMIGDIACDPDSSFSPIKIYAQTTTWQSPALRVHKTPLLDVTAIDNLPSLLPLESSEDFAAQLLPHLVTLAGDPNGLWTRARQTFQTHL